MPLGLNHWWLILLLIIVLIVFGPGKLPQLGAAVGQALREFRKATTELKDEVAKATAHENEPSAPAAATGVTTPAATTPEPITEHKHESTKA
jgi:sec-independent protein translocase protein TatA